MGKRKKNCKKYDKFKTLNRRLKDIREPIDSLSAQALIEALREKSWEHVVHLLLEHDYSRKLKNIAVQHFRYKTKGEEVISFDNLKAIVSLHLSDCGDAMEVIITLVQLGLCTIIDWILQCGLVSSSQQERVLTELCKCAKQDNIEKHVLPHCDVEQLNCILSYLVEKKLWSFVGVALRDCGKNKDVHHWKAVVEAARNADSTNFEQHILPNCSDDLLELALPDLVEHNDWRIVHKVLDKGVSEHVKNAAVEYAALHAEGGDFLQYILPHCNVKQIETVLPRLVSRQL
jgi:hypothetical protein